MNAINLKHNSGMGSLCFFFDGGAPVFEKPGHRGTMHLMEHLIMKNCDDLRDEFQKCGMDYNAYTDEDGVAFWFRGLDEHIEKLSERLHNALLGGLKATGDQFETEKKVVLQEYADCFNRQEDGGYYNLKRKYFKCASAIGIAEDIRSFTYQKAHEVYSSVFNKPSRIVRCGQNTNKTESTSLLIIDEKLPLYLTGTDDMKQEDYVKEKKRLILVHGKNKYGCFSDYYNLEILMNILNNGLQSPLYQEIREIKGLSYFSWACLPKIGDECIILFGASTTIEREAELKDVYAAFIDNIKKHITRERYELAISSNLNVAKIHNMERYRNITEYSHGQRFNKYRTEKTSYEKIMSMADKINSGTMETTVW